MTYKKLGNKRLRLILKYSIGCNQKKKQILQKLLATATSLNASEYKSEALGYRHIISMLD